MAGLRPGIQAFLFVFAIILQDAVSNEVEKDCMFIEHEFVPATGGHKMSYLGSNVTLEFPNHYPCYNENETTALHRDVARNISCDNGNLVHVCCITSSTRQNEARAPKDKSTFVPGSAPPSSAAEYCARLLLCNKGCRDDHPLTPESIRKDLDANWALVDSNRNCVTLREKIKYHDYRDRQECLRNCWRKFQDLCTGSKMGSFESHALYLSALTFDQLGEWALAGGKVVYDTFVKEGKKQWPDGPVLIRGVKKGFETLYERMTKLKNAYWKWVSNAMKDPSTSHGFHPKDLETWRWEEYLEIYEKTDPSLVKSLKGSMDYDEFESAYKVIDETLRTHPDFKGVSTVEGGSMAVVPSGVVMMIGAYWVVGSFSVV